MRWWPALASVVVLGLIGTAVLLLDSGDSENAAPDPGGSTRAPVRLPPRAKLFGFSDQTFAYTGAPDRSLDQGVTAEREVADSLAAGANSHRLVVAWWGVEPQPGRVDYAYLGRLKRFSDALERAGGRVMLTLLTPPPWAAAKPRDPRSAIAPGRPGLVRAFGRYAALVARTFPRAAAIETWNEPNNRFFWAPGGPDPDLYVRMHREATRAIRGVAPRMKVLFGGLLATSVQGDADVLQPSEFLRRAARAGLSRSDYEALSVHVYPEQSGGEAGPLETGAFAEAFADFRRGYRGRDPGARVWITETGLTTSGPQAVTPAAQGRLADLVRKLLSMRDVDAVYLHTLYDVAGRSADNPERGFGVLQARGSNPPQPKPAFCVLRSLRRERGPHRGCPGQRPADRATGASSPGP